MTASIVECVLRSSALIGIVWLVLKILPVRSPRLERSAWLLVLASSGAMPLLMQLPALPVAEAPDLPWLRAIDLVTVPIAASGNDWRTLLPWALMSVAIALAIRHTLGIVRCWSMRRAARRVSSSSFAGLDIRVTSAVSSPATVFSTVLVPIDFEAWSLDTQRAVMAHERAHVENKDFYVQWLAHLHRCAFWFNPLAWWLASRLSILGEHISDDAVVRATGDRAAYAEVLLGFAGSATRGEPLVTMARKKTLGPRIERILHQDTPAEPGRRRVCLLLGSLLPVVGIAGGFRAVSARESEESLAASNAGVVLPKRNPAIPLSPPVYPPASRRLKEQGTVVLRLHVLEDGSVADAVIAQSSGYPDLDHSAYSEVLQWRLDPGTIDGVPAPMWGRFAVTFKLTEE
jgi:TonB family protein